jgi:hypothetical protein
MALTGKKRFRATWRGRLVLQVEYSYTYTFTSTLVCETRYKWRDAKLEDVNQMVALELTELKKQGFPS